MKDTTLEHNIVTLYHGRGWSERKLSREFGISRGRVKRIIERHNQQRLQGDEPAADTERGSKLDPYKDYITEILDTHKSPPVTVQRVFEMLLEKGYAGGKTIVSIYLARVRGSNVKEPVFCVEQSPGQRSSHDWSDYMIFFTDTGQKHKVTFFSYILNYSRRQYVEPVEDKTQRTLFLCLINAFIYMDGVPREIKSDNQKACVDRWECGKPVFNKTFLDFASHYRFTPLTIHPGKPRENLKIERPFYYLEKNFLNARSFANVQDLKEQLKLWLTDVNDQRIHRTTKRKPIDLYVEEFACLQSLPQQHYDMSVKDYRVVDTESCISWLGFSYMVPGGNPGQICLVRQSDQQLIIYGANHEKLVEHPLARQGHTEKYIGRQAPRRPSKSSNDIAEVISRLETMGEPLKTYIREIKQHRPSRWAEHLKKILSLKVNYHTHDIILAINRALRYKVYDGRSIENFLQMNVQKKNEITILQQKNRKSDEQA